MTGQVTLGDEAAVGAIARAVAVAGGAVERITAATATRRFPGIAPTGTGPVLVEPDSGVLVADECLRAFGEGGGFELRTASPVTSLRQASPDSVTVETAGGHEFDADVVVDCAGPCALALAGVGSAVAAAPSLPQVAYFRTRRPGDALPPVFIEWGDDMVYGLPVPGHGPHAGTFKVSHHTPGPALFSFDPADPAPLASDDPALRARLTDAVRRLLPALDPEPVATERCVYDNSADTDFVLDRVGRIVVGCGTSGHAFKFGPLLGELLADLAEGAPPPVDLRRFGLDRPPTPSHGPAGEAR